jgi:HEPN domain-containing protein
MASSSTIESIVPKPQSEHSAESWIAKADEDIFAVGLCLSAGEDTTNIGAFHLQQAAEKLLKALIASTGTEPPYVHDLAELAELATVDFPAAQVLTTQIEEITSWAVVTRYPSRGDSPLPTRHEIGQCFR